MTDLNAQLRERKFNFISSLFDHLYFKISSDSYLLEERQEKHMAEEG